MVVECRQYRDGRSNLLVWLGKELKGVLVCWLTLAFWHDMQSLDQVTQSLLSASQINRNCMSFVVLLIPGWDKLCNKEKICLRNETGM